MRKMQDKRRRFLRRGTIMIMVVALLVLLALMGTAWIASVSTDRSTSRSNTRNTQADLNIEAVADMVKSRVGLSDLMWADVGGALPVFRPRSQGGSQKAYVPWTCPVPNCFTYNPNNPNSVNIARAQEFLASRTPAAQKDNQGNFVRNGQLLTVFWPAISAPLYACVPSTVNPLNIYENSSYPSSGCEFESPYNRTITWPLPPNVVPQVVRYNHRLNLSPGFISLNVNGVSTSCPAFILPNGTRVLAADADGDGIADAGLWPLPGGTIDGVTWYAAVRIIDNNSAINANTAWQWANLAPVTNQSSPPPSGTPANLFPSNIDITALIKNPTGQAKDIAIQVDNLNYSRFGETARLFNQVISDGGTPVDWAQFLSGGYDALWHQLGRRLENPGSNFIPNRPLAKFSAFSISEQLALGYRFIYENPAASSELERCFTSKVNNQWVYTLESPTGNLNSSLTFNNADIDVTRWFDKNFNYEEELTPAPYPGDGWKDYSRRAIMVTRNPVSMQIDPAGGFAQYWGVASNNPFAIVPPGVFGTTLTYSPIPSKVSLNTASFYELWLGFWNVMADHLPSPDKPQQNWSTWDTTPFYLQMKRGTPSPYVGMDFKDQTQDPIPALNAARQFRSVVRDNNAQPGVTMDPSQVLLLRSAIAAVNTIRLRSGVQDAPVSPLIPDPFKLNVSMGGQVVAVDVSVFPAQPQPFITEVYVNMNDTARRENDPRNPDGYIAIELYNPTDQEIRLTDDWRIGYITRSGIGAAYNATLTIPSGPEGKIKSTQDPVVIPPGKHLVIENYNNGGSAQYRPPSAKLAIESASRECDPASLPALSQCIDRELVLVHRRADGRYIPVDQFDLTGLRRASLNKDPDNKKVAISWHYARKTTQPFRCVYPGRYVGNRPLGSDPQIPPPHQQGTDYVKWLPEEAAEPWETTQPASAAITLGTANPNSSYPKSEFTIQLFGKAGPDTGKYPFGGFARVGDVLQVPFIGAYAIKRPGSSDNEFIEFNSLPMDAAFAEDTDTSNDAMENIGRFCPPLNLQGNSLSVGDDWSNTDSSTWRYHWAMKVFDYFTVFAPYDDYLPNVPRDMQGNIPGRPVANSDPAVANTIDERLLGVDGLININTAPWRVLAALPMVCETDQIALKDIPSVNANLAKAIVRYRDGGYLDSGQIVSPHGPFKSLFDLYKVPEIQDYVAQRLLNTNLQERHGNINGSASSAAIKGDFLNQYLFLTRISNLVTTRSDTFTCYLLVQGWKNVGTNNPQLVAERRSAFVLDRTGVTPDCAVQRAGVNPQKAGLKVTVFPNE